MSFYMVTQAVQEEEDEFDTMEPLPSEISSTKSGADERLARRLHVLKKPPKARVNKRQASLFDLDSTRKLRLWESRGYFTQSHCDKPLTEEEQGRQRFELTHQLSTQSRVKTTTPPVTITYKTEPDKKFQDDRVRAILREELQAFQDEKYSPEKSRLISKHLSERIKERVKELEFDRYRYVCLVTTGAILGQDLRITSRCMWDAQRDNSASESIQNHSMFIEATVFGLYKD